jgi:hypothetical protein
MRPAVAVARIDEHHVAIDLDDPALEHQVEVALVVEEVRIEPVAVRGQQRLVSGEGGDVIADPQLLAPADQGRSDLHNCRCRAHDGCNLE